MDGEGEGVGSGMETVQELQRELGQLGTLSNDLSCVFHRLLCDFPFTSAFLIPQCFVYEETGRSEVKRLCAGKTLKASFQMSSEF